MELPPLLVRSSEENKIIFHKWTKVPSHLSCQMSFGADITTDRLCLYWTCPTLFHCTVLPSGFAGWVLSYETWEYHNYLRCIKKNKCQNRVYEDFQTTPMYCTSLQQVGRIPWKAWLLVCYSSTRANPATTFLSRSMVTQIGLTRFSFTRHVKHFFSSV